MKLIIQIPCYNEEKTLELAYRDLPRHIDGIDTIEYLIINDGSNVLLGSVWKAMLYGKGYLYYLTSGAVKNTIMLPIEVFLTWVVLNAAAKQGLDRKFIHKR